jgi:CRISPR-associated protein Csx16
MSQIVSGGVLIFADFWFGPGNRHYENGIVAGGDFSGIKRRNPGALNSIKQLFEGKIIFPAGFWSGNGDNSDERGERCLDNDVALTNHCESSWFVTRHPGAVEWAKRHDFPIDHIVSHLDIEKVKPGDRVMGTLPVDIAAEICRKGAAFYHLRMNTTELQRGKEISADDMDAMQVRLERYSVVRLDDEDKF